METLIQGDTVQHMSSWRDGVADICITSPPYKNCDGYSLALMHDFCRQVYRILKPNSLFFLNFGHLAEDKFRPFKVCEAAMAQGFKLNETVTWVKNHYKPIQGTRRLNNLSEFIFILYKDTMPKLDRLAIGIPYADKSNAKRFAGGNDLKCRGNVWYIPYENIHSSEQKLHNDRFPLELPITCLKLSGLKKGMVLEPFAGSGTTLLAAKQLGLNSIGCEKDPNHYSTALKRLELTSSQV